jgi:hypothetical protein
MLEALYILLFATSTILLFAGLTNILKLSKPSRRLIMIITMVISVVLMYASFSIEGSYCVYTTEFLCHTEESQSLVAAIIAFMYVILSILYIILDALGYIQDAIKGKDSESVV